MNRLNAPTFFDLAVPVSGSNVIVRNTLLVVLGSLILAISARAQVNIGPIPITLQTLALMVMGATYGWRLAGLTVVTYLTYGIMGFAVFANPPFTGIVYLLASPSAGFLWGFIAGAMFIGAAAQWGMARNPVMLAGAMMIAHVIIYIPGVLWGSTFIGETWLPQGELFNVFVTPFLLGDTIKILIAVAVVPVSFKAIEAIKSN